MFSPEWVRAGAGCLSGFGTLGRCAAQNGGCCPDFASLVPGDAWVDRPRPLVDATGQRLCLVEALLPKPHGDVEGAGAVMAEDNQRLVGIELLVGSRGDFAHGHEDGARYGGKLHLPGLADVEQGWGMGLLERLGEGVDGDLWRKHAGTG